MRLLQRLLRRGFTPRQEAPLWFTKRRQYTPDRHRREQSGCRGQPEIGQVRLQQVDRAETAVVQAITLTPLPPPNRF